MVLKFSVTESKNDILQAEIYLLKEIYQWNGSIKISKLLFKCMIFPSSTEALTVLLCYNT